MLKLLYDIEQLLNAHGKEAGICRVSLEILREISHNPDYDVYPLATIKSADATGYLRAHGLPELAKKVVYLPYLKKSTKHYNWRQRIKSALLLKLMRRKYLNELNRYDEYISIFSPLSPLVYESRLKTKAIIHDLIPLKFPQYCNADFARKYAFWMRDVNADEIICVSRHTKEDFLAYRPEFPEEKIKVAYLAAGDNFKPAQMTPELRRKYGIPQEKYFLGVSELSGRKNFAHLADAFAAFLERSGADDVCLVIAGAKRANCTKFEQKISAINNKHKNKIILSGFVDDKDMPALYSGAEAFIYPSLYEGFGLPILEAMQCGVPVICSNNSSLPEVGGNAAVYISGADLNETADALARLHNNPNLRTELRRKSLQQAGHFSWHTTAEQIFNK